MTEQTPRDTQGAEDEAQADPLVDRLRRLSWPDVPEEMRSKSWERFAAMIEQQTADEKAGPAVPFPPPSCGR